MLDLVGRLTKGYTVCRSQENHTRPIRDALTILFRKAAEFVLLLALGPRATQLEVHQVLLEATNAAFAGVMKIVRFANFDRVM